MKEFKGTPGPWTIQGASDDYEEFKIEAKDWGIILKCEDISNESRENARLVAAAPELLAALEDVLDQINNAPQEWFAEECEGFDFSRAYNAIAGALGESYLD